MVRCHPSIYEPDQFYERLPGQARFSAFTAVGASEALRVLYAASTVDGALSETVLHDVPVRGDKRISRSDAAGMQVSTLDVTRPLMLADATSIGLRRIGVSRLELIESDRRAYLETARWARAVHAHEHSDGYHFDGLIWVSRQHDSSRAVVLFGDRVTSAYGLARDPNPPDPSSMPDVAPCADPEPLPLAFGAGQELLDSICDRADIAVIDP